MRRTFFFELLTLTVAILLVACSAESSTEQTSTDGMEPANVDVPTTLVRVFVNTQNLFSETDGALARQQNQEDTRGVGPFQISKYERTNFYIYAFRAKTYENPTYDVPDFRHYRLVNKDSENAPNSHVPSDPALDDSAEKRHCLLDGQDYNKGLLANLKMEGNNNAGMFKFKTPLLPDDSGERELIYYPDYGSRGFNFFAYSIGDISTDDFSTTDNTVDWGQCERLENQVVYRNFTVDGSQDVMVGYAPPIQYALDAATNLTDAEKEDIEKFGYCTFAAHRGVDPVVNLKHQMTRIRFRGVAGDQSSQHTAIHSIAVKCYNKGDFVVAHRDTNQVGFHPYTTSTDLLGDVYVHDKPELVYDTDGKVVDITPSKIHDTDGLDEDGNPLVDRDDSWHVDWLEKYNIYDDPEHPNVVTDKAPLNERLKDAVTFGDDLLLPPSGTINVYIKSYYRNIVKYTEDLPDDQKKYDVRSFTSHYVIKAADLVACNPKLEDKYLDDRHYAATGEKRYIFKPGYYYTITLVVYGLSPIKVYANIDAWPGGEDITVGEGDINVY